MSKFNLNTNHPLIPNSQEYIYYQKYVTIYSNDRDIIKYPNASEFEIELPQDYLNVVGVMIQSPSFPSVPVFTSKNNNLQFSFKIKDPYNPNVSNSNNQFLISIYEALLANIDNNYVIYIEEGTYFPSQMATELTNKMNEAVTKYISNYLKNNDTINYSLFTSYDEFVVVHNKVSNKLWFGNKSSNFTITNSNILLYGNNTSNMMNQCNVNALPSYSDWGLPANLGFTREDISGITLPNGELPRFYYGDYVSGDNGYWINNNATLLNSNVYFLQAPLELNITGDFFYYVDIKELNCIDVLSPFNLNKYTITTNSSNARVNSSFSRVSIGTNVPALGQLYSSGIPYKLYDPPAERIRRLQISVRTHSGQLVDFGNQPFSFMLNITLYNANIPRKYNVYNPDI
jgi:hypothetical protein